MTILPRPLLALLASAASAMLLGAWPMGSSAGLVAAAGMFAIAYAAAWASRATPARALIVGSLAGLSLAPPPLALAACAALYALTRGRTAANDNAAPRWDDGVTFAPWR